MYHPASAKEGKETRMRLAEASPRAQLSLRLGHHFPEALPYLLPFYQKAEAAGFQIDKNKIKPVLSRNGKRIVVDYSKADSSVSFRLYRQPYPFVTMNLSILNHQLKRVRRPSGYHRIDKEINNLVRELRRATDTN